MSEIFDVLKEEKEKELLKELFTGENVTFKTELDNPTAISSLEVLSNYLNDFDEEIGKAVTRWVSLFKKNMVSYRRKSRKEFVNAIRYKKEEGDEEENIKKWLKV